MTSPQSITIPPDATARTPNPTTTLTVGGPAPAHLPTEPRPMMVEIPNPWAEQFLHLIAEAKARPAPVPLESVVEPALGTGVLGFIVGAFAPGDDVPQFLSERLEPYASLTDARRAADNERRLEDRAAAVRAAAGVLDRPRVEFRPLALIEVTS